MTELPVPFDAIVNSTQVAIPAVIADAGDQAAGRFLEFFAATIRNANTRSAYARATSTFFAWCETRGLTLNTITPIAVAAYIENLMHVRSAPTVKLHLAAIRMVFDWLVTGQIVPTNPAASVRGPKHVVKKGKTLVLSAEQTRELLDSIDTATLIGLRDRALIALMAFSFARISAVVQMNVEDYYANGKRWWLRLKEKGGKHHEVPAHHNVEAYLDAYIQVAGIGSESKSPLFRAMPGKPPQLSGRRLSRSDALAMVKRRAIAGGLPGRTCNHSFRATGITTYLQNGGTLENAQAIAAHESPRTTMLYDRRSEGISLDEIERIVI